jgi:hypothetical protein
VTRLRVGRPEFDSRWELGFSLHYRVQTGSGAQAGSYPNGYRRLLTLGLKRPGREAYHSPPSSAEVTNAWSYTSTVPYVFMAWCLVTHTGTTLPLPYCVIGAEKLIVAQIVTKYPAFYGTRKFITMFTRARNCNLYCASWIRYTPSHSHFHNIYLNAILSSSPRSSKWALSFIFSG